MTSPWHEWKKKNLEAQKQGIVGPTALLNPDTPKVSENESNDRYSVCEECPSLLPTKQCKECGCFMPAKVKLLYSSCPKGLW